MRYKAWLNYSQFSIAVEETNGLYRCIEFESKNMTRKGVKDCTDVLDLKFYLLSLPNPPKKEISSLIFSLSNSKIGTREINNAEHVIDETKSTS